MPRPKHGTTGAVTSRAPSLGEGAGKGSRLRAELVRTVTEMAPGDLFPSDRAIAEHYGLARMTVRSQVDALVKQGMLERLPGKGTFVTAPGDVRADVLPDFSSEMRARGHTPGAVVLSLRVAKATRADRRALHLDEGGTVIRLDRLRLADGAPVGIERSRLPGDRFAGLSRSELERSGLYDVLAAKYGAAPERATQTVDVVTPGAKDAERLDLSNGSPVLSVERFSKDAMGRPVESRVAIYRPDRYELRMQLVLAPVVPG